MFIQRWLSKTEFYIWLNYMSKADVKTQNKNVTLVYYIYW